MLIRPDGLSAWTHNTLSQAVLEEVVYTTPYHETAADKSKKEAQKGSDSEVSTLTKYGCRNIRTPYVSAMAGLPHSYSGPVVANQILRNEHEDNGSGVYVCL